MRVILLAALLVIALTAVPARADFQDGVAAYTKGDYAAALEQFRPLAEAGEDAAQLILGAMYASGQGLMQDYARAVTWYRRAAEQGNPSAQNSLGVMYELGAGVERDPKMAYVWFNLAAAQTERNPTRGDALRNRDRVARRLTPERLTEAQQLSREHEERIATLGESAPTPEPETPAAKAPAAESAEPAPAAESAAPAPVTTGFATPIGPIRKRLAMLGYDPGSSDGALDARTRAAIRTFERDNDMPETGEVTAALVDALRAAKPRHREIRRDSAASGFVVSRAGHIVTALHVVKDCLKVRLSSGDDLDRVASDPLADLALLKGPPTEGPVATFRAGREVLQGESIVAAGFPLQGLITSQVTVTTGIVSAIAGPQDDRRIMQITAPIQRGSSGGPLLDLSGDSVGVIVAKLDALMVAERTGDLPQNVNFAVSGWVVKSFLEANGVGYEISPSPPSLNLSEVAARARKFTVLVECWR